MEIYTGYFAQTAKYKKAMLVPISIARMQQWKERLPEIPELAPSSQVLWEYKMGMIDKDTYKSFYFGALEKLNESDIMSKIVGICGNLNPILLCYEKSGDFCHRHLFADFAREKWGWEIQEFILD